YVDCFNNYLYISLFSAMGKSNRQMSHKKKLKKNDTGQNNEDRLSSLPDNILHKILDLLDTLYAVRSSILSKRWRDLWTCLSNLNFNSTIDYEATNKHLNNKDEIFTKFVDQVFIHRDRSCNIRTFHLFYNEEHFRVPHRFCSWILGSIQCNVQELNINISTFYSLHLPSCLFECKPLKVLKLKFGSIQVPLKLRPWFFYPGDIALPNLKTLHLESVCFVGEELANKLFSNCPVLESLVIINSQFVKLKSFLIIGPNLKHIVIENCSDELDVDSSYCEIIIHASKLVALRCKDHMDRHYTLEMPCSLVDVSMDMGIEDLRGWLRGGRLQTERKKQYALNMLTYLKSVCSVRSLTLSPWLIEVFSNNPGIEKSLSVSVQFQNLRYMKLKTWLSRDHIPAILCLLHISPNVETLILEVTKKMVNSTYRRENQDTEFPLQCMDHLKFVEIQGSQGRKNELKILEILLKNAEILEKVVVFTSMEQLPDREQRLMDFSEKLRQYPRASSNTVITFI
ncbi:hypothetical protein IFM89_016174, partial [Coptis chinensis]